MFLHNKDGKICCLAEGPGTIPGNGLAFCWTEVGITSTIRVPTGTSVIHGLANGS